MEKAGLHTTEREFVDAPLIEELPMAFECRFIKVNEDGNIVGEIINVNAYVKLGEKVGNAFSDGAELG